MNALKALPRDVEAVETLGDAPPTRREDTVLAGTAIVLPRQEAARLELGDRKDVRELQDMIERAFVMLDEAADAEGRTATAAPEPTPSEKSRTMGPAAGSEVKFRTSWASRIFKTLAGTAIVVAVGLVPLQRVTMPVSNEAFVDAPVYDLHAPIGGVIATGQLILGALVERGVPLAMVADPQSSAGDTAIVSGGSGKVWQVLVRSGDRVAKGDLIARVVGCTATQVTATVSEPVYDRLKPGMPARFNFLGSRQAYAGTVAALLGHAAVTESAVSSAALAADGYRVAISVPDLGAIEGCAVGRRGIAIFGQSS